MFRQNAIFFCPSVSLIFSDWMFWFNISLSHTLDQRIFASRNWSMNYQLLHDFHFLVLHRLQQFSKIAGTPLLKKRVYNGGNTGNNDLQNFFSLLEVNCDQAILFPFDRLKIRKQVLRSHENHAQQFKNLNSKI